MKVKGQKDPDTRERLLRAAGEVFARSGFKSATVREIAERANANIASINYHFGDKKNLYAEVLEYSLSSAIKRYPPDFGLPPDSTVEERLHGFIRSLLFRLLDDGRPAWHGKLMTREISDPTAAFDQVIDNVLRPLYGYLTGIVKELIGEGATDELIRIGAFSIMGQCLFYRNARHVISRLYSEDFAPGRIERLSMYITELSLRAIRNFAEEAKDMGT